MLDCKELRKVNKQIKVEDIPKINETIKEIIRLSQVARHYGLLELEIEANKKETNKFLADGLMLIVDGNDPEYVELILMNIYYVNGYKGIKALQTLMVIEGLLAIQAGTNPYVILEILLSMVSDKIKLADKLLDNGSYESKFEFIDEISKEVSDEANIVNIETKQKKKKAKKKAKNEDNLVGMLTQEEVKELSTKPTEE